jgi:hypothetical protein
VARQLRMQIDDTDYYLDLLFLSPQTPQTDRVRLARARLAAAKE